MKRISFFSVVSVMALLVACNSEKQAESAVPRTVNKTVEYACGANGKDVIAVTYRFEDQNPVFAEMIYQGQKVAATRYTEIKEGTRFVSPENIVWVADDNLTLDTVAKTSGNMLYKQGNETDQIIVKYCTTVKSVK